ncbi:MAG: GNAT family N-acetyltransferase [Dehalococcoidia bacterium]
MAEFLRVNGFDEVEEEWQQLLPFCTAPSVFLTPGWQRSWWQRLGTESELLLLRLTDDDRTMGIAPLAQRDGELSFIGDTDLFDYHDFLVSRESETLFYPALLDYLGQEQWRTLRFTSLPEGSPTLDHLPALARERGYQVAIELEDVVPGLPLPLSWDDYLARLSKKGRHELRRKLRRLESAGEHRCSDVSHSTSFDADLDDFFRMLRESRAEKHKFLTPQRQQFFETIARELARQGVLRLFFLELDGQRVATTMCFDYGMTRALYNSGFDPAYRHLSAGLLLKALCLKDAIERGMTYFDFLRGDERYKYDLGGKDRSLYRLVVQRC